MNGLRGVAILGVVYHHALGPFLHPRASLVPGRSGAVLEPGTLLVNGWLGVNLFFLLSGFVLSLPYELGADGMSTRERVLHYYGRRARRLLPLYYLCLLAAIFVTDTVNVLDPAFFRHAWRLATFTFIFDEWTFFPKWNPVLWSLGDEAWFSLAFPLLVVASRRFGIRKVLFAALGLSLGVRIHAALGLTGGAAPLLYSKDGILGRLDDFVVGMAVAARYASGRLPGGRRAAALFAAGFVALVASSIAWDNVDAGVLPYVACAPLNDAVQAAFSAMFLALLTPSATRLKGIFSARPLQVIGMMSYSVYAWHVLGGHGKSWNLDGVPLALFLVFALSAVTYRFVEFPDRPARALFFPGAGPRAA